MSARLHLVANSHIDPVWLWDKYEGIDEVLNTFRSACDRLDEYAGLSFTGSSLQFYEWVREYDPGLFERIQTRVAEGRWEVVGSWWVEPDSNLPTAASFRQHAQISRQFARAHFPGIKTEVAYLPDSFGHPATLPKMLNETGFRYFVFCRPGQHEKPDLPANLFWWEYAGHRVLAYRVKHHYLQPQPDGQEREDELRRRLADPEFEAAGAHAFFFGMGDHGGGPTIREIDFYCRYMKERPAAEIVFSTCQRFFEEAALQPDIPSYAGDLHMHAVGCYSVMRDLKAGVRSAEHGLDLAGRALAMAGEDAGQLTPLWKRTLFNQFHDILPGSCSPAAADMARADLGGVDEAWRTTTYEALKRLAAAKPVQAAEGEFRVFNTLPFEVRMPLRIESFQYYREGAAFLDDEGREITIQEVLPSVRCSNRRWEFVDTLPAQGFRSYHFDREQEPAQERAQSASFAPGEGLQTAHLCVDGSGMRTATGAALLAPLRFLVLEDTSDTWGHGRRRYDEVIGAFELERAAVARGPVVERLYERWYYCRSTVEVVYSAYAELDMVYVDVVVNWAEDRKILKLELTPAACAGDTFDMEGAGGGITRARNGEEMPLHHWVQMRGSERTFTVLQDGAFACDCEAQRLRVNLVRSNLYGFHDPVKLVEADPQHLTDQGLHQFRLGLHFGEWTEAQKQQQVAAFLEPGWVIREGQRRD